MTILDTTKTLTGINKDTDSNEFKTKLTEIQKLLGVTDDSLSKIFFCSIDWQNLTRAERVETISRYISAEMNYTLID